MSLKSYNAVTKIFAAITLTAFCATQTIWASPLPSRHKAQNLRGVNRDEQQLPVPQITNSRLRRMQHSEDAVSKAGAAGKKAVQARAENKTVNKILRLILWLTIRMIYEANIEKYETKTGGHPASCGSSLHIMAALELFVKKGHDHVAHKPHAAPVYHAIQYLLNNPNAPKEALFRLRENPIEPAVDKDIEEMIKQAPQEAQDGFAELTRRIMEQLPKSAKENLDAPGFQSYPGMVDRDGITIPTGSMGLGPAMTIALAVQQEWLKKNGFNVPDSHYWAVVGDAETKEGNLQEILPLAREFGLSSVTHIVDFNRQSLDGNIENPDEELQLIKDRYAAAGWKVVELRWGRRIQAIAKKTEEGKLFAETMDKLSNKEYQALVYGKSGDKIRKALLANQPGLKNFLNPYTDQKLYDLFTDLAGHDIAELIDALKQARENKQAVVIIAHTIKGWGLKSLMADPSNHAKLLAADELEALRQELGIPETDPFPGFAQDTPEGKLLRRTARRLERETQIYQRQVEENQQAFVKEFQDKPLSGTIVKRAPAVTSTQIYLWLIINELRNTLAKRFHTISPDVATSTSVLTRGADTKQHFPVGIAEMNALTLAVCKGKSWQFTGAAVFPLVAIYDAFLFKRALTQIDYGQYWKSRFFMVGTPTLLPSEGAQHQPAVEPVISHALPNVITWEPAYAVELDYIVHDSLRRMANLDDEERNVVYLRLNTLLLDQRELLKRLGKEKLPDEWIENVLRGGYMLVNHRGKKGYAPGRNVINLVAAGPLAQKALAASDMLLEFGIFANVIVVTSVDLLKGYLAEDDGYSQLKKLIPEHNAPVITVSGASPFYLAGIGDIIPLRAGVKNLGIKKSGLSTHSIHGFYRHHGISQLNIAQAAYAMINMQQVSVAAASAGAAGKLDTEVDRIKEWIDSPQGNGEAKVSEPALGTVEEVNVYTADGKPDKRRIKRLSRLGSGFAGVVYEAVDVDTGKRFVEKYYGNIPEKSLSKRIAKSFINFTFGIFRGTPLPYKINIYAVLSNHCTNLIAHKAFRDYKHGFGYDVIPKIIYTRYDKATSGYVQAFEYVSHRPLKAISYTPGSDWRRVFRLGETRRAIGRMRQWERFLSQELGMWGIAGQIDFVNLNSLTNIVVDLEGRFVILDIVPGFFRGLLLPFEIKYFIKSLWKLRFPAFADAIDFQRLRRFVGEKYNDDKQMQNWLQLLEFSVARWRQTEPLKGHGLITYLEYKGVISAPQAHNYHNQFTETGRFPHMFLHTLLRMAPARLHRLLTDSSYRIEIAKNIVNQWLKEDLKYNEINDEQAGQVLAELENKSNETLLGLYGLQLGLKMLIARVSGFGLGCLLLAVVTHQWWIALGMFVDGAIRLVSTIALTGRSYPIAMIIGAMPVIGIFGVPAQMLKTSPALMSCIIRRMFTGAVSNIPGLGERGSLLYVAAGKAADATLLSLYTLTRVGDSMSNNNNRTGAAATGRAGGRKEEIALEAKEKRLKTILWARGYSVETERELGAAIKKELQAQEGLFANTLIPVEIKTDYTTIAIQRQMPSPKAISKNENVTVNVFQDEQLIDPGKAHARMVYADFIRWILWEKGFHGEDRKIDFSTYGIPSYRGTYLFKIGPLVNLPAYVKLLVREKLKKQNIHNKGLMLLETERALNLIAEWFLEHGQGTDYGVGLAALYVGVPDKDKKTYIAAATGKPKNEAHSGEGIWAIFSDDIEEEDLYTEVVPPKDSKQAINSESVEELMNTILNDENSANSRKDAAEILGDLAVKEIPGAAENIDRLATNEDEAVRRLAIKAYLSAKNTVRLIKMLKDEEPLVRETTAMAFSELGDTSALRALQSAYKKEEDKGARSELFKSIMRLNTILSKPTSAKAIGSNIPKIMFEHVKEFSAVYDDLCFNKPNTPITRDSIAERMRVERQTVGTILRMYNSTIDEWRIQHRLLPVVYEKLKGIRTTKGKELAAKGFVIHVNYILEYSGLTLEHLKESDLGLDPEIKNKLIGPGKIFENWDMAKQYVFINTKQGVKPDTQQSQEDSLPAKIETALAKIKDASKPAKQPREKRSISDVDRARSQRTKKSAADIIDIFARGDEKQRKEILELLRQRNSPEAVTALYWILIEQDRKADIDYYLAQRAIENLGEMAKSGLGIAIKYLADIRGQTDSINDGYRYQAIKALANSKKDIAFAHIRSALEGPLRDPDWTVRDLAADVLNKAGYNVAVSQAPFFGGATEEDDDVLEAEDKDEERVSETIEPIPDISEPEPHIGRSPIEELPLFDDDASFAGASGGVVTVKRVYLKADRDDRSDTEIRYDLNAREISVILRALKEPGELIDEKTMDDFLNELREDSDIKVRYSGWTKKGLAKRSEFLRRRIRSYNSAFIKVNEHLEQALKNNDPLEIKSALRELNKLNEEVVMYVKRRLLVQLMMAGMQLKEKDYSARTTQVLKGIRNSYRALAWEYGWRRRRQSSAALVEKFRAVGIAGSVVFTFGFGGLDIKCDPTADKDKYPHGKITIRQQRWVTKQFPDGKIIYEPSWRDIEHEDISSGLRSQAHTMASQEEDYMTVLYYMSVLDYAAERLEEFRDNVPFYVRQEVDAVLGSALEWASRGRVDQKKSQEGVQAILEGYSDKLERNTRESISRLAEVAMSCVDVLDTRLADIEDKKKGVARRAESIYIYIRNEDVKNGCEKIKAATKVGDYSSAYLEAEKLRKTYFETEISEFGYEFYRNRMISVAMAFEMLSVQERYNAQAERMRMMLNLQRNEKERLRYEEREVKITMARRVMQGELASIINIKSRLKGLLPRRWHNAVEGRPAELIMEITDECAKNAQKYMNRWNRAHSSMAISSNAMATGNMNLTKLRELREYDDSIKRDARYIRNTIGGKPYRSTLLMAARENLRKRLVEHGYVRREDLSACISVVDRILYKWRLKQYQKKSLASIKAAAARAMSKIKKTENILENYGIAQKTDYEPQHMALYVFEVMLRLEKTIEETSELQYNLRQRLAEIAFDMRSWQKAGTDFPQAQFLSYAKALEAISKQDGVSHITRARLLELSERLDEIIKAYEVIIAIESLELSVAQVFNAPDEAAIALSTGL